MQNRTAALAATIVPVMLSFLSLGCQFGPSAVRVGQSEYNEAIQNAASEQLLLNLVRLKYRESPLVLDVGSISAQFEIMQGASVSGTLNENVGQALRGFSHQINNTIDGPSASFTRNAGRIHGSNPDSLTLGGQFVYAERPTVTYTPIRGEDFVKRMLTPITLPTIVMLANSGWRIDRVFSITVEELNGLENVAAASGPTPDQAPEYQRFNEVLDILRALQEQRTLWLEFETVPVALSDPIPAERVTPEAMLQAATNHTRFSRADTPDQYVLTQNVEKLYLRFVPTPQNEAQVKRLRELLRLAPDRSKFELLTQRAEAADSAAPGQVLSHISVDTRSLIGVMFYLSQSVQSPDAHVRAGFVTRTLDREGQPFDWSVALGRVMKVYSSMFRPLNAAVAVRRFGRWYFIRNDDLSSKSTFMLLAQLFALRSGEGAGSGRAPLLTIPIGR